MTKFSTGLVTGGILGVVGLTIALSDKSARKKAVKTGRRIIDDAQDAIDDVKSKIW